jgi:beta-phosphoglucomutase
MHSIPIPFSQFEAVIFDMDGTMINNTAYHQKAWLEYLKQYGIQLSGEEYLQKVSGKKNDQIVKELFGPSVSPHKIKVISDEKEALYRELYADFIEEVPGLTKFIDKLHKRRIRTAIATTAQLQNRNFALVSLGLEDRFEVILGDEHVRNGKPDPEIYLKTSQELGVAPEKCIVFEDSPPGVQAAKNAGMTAVGVLTMHKTEHLRSADFLIHNFAEIQL